MPAPLKRAILLVDHGSRLEEANELLAAVSRLVAARAPDRFVTHAHLELAEPSIAAGFAACVAAGATDVTVHPYMLGPGRHSTQDIPRLVAAAASGHPGVSFRVTEPLGLHQLIADVVIERVKRAEGS